LSFWATGFIDVDSSWRGGVHGCLGDYLRLLGRSISFADRLALRDSFGLLDLNAILELTRRVLMAVFSMEGIGAFLLWLHWRADLGDGARCLLCDFPCGFGFL
jgi:hypothetical protein